MIDNQAEKNPNYIKARDKFLEICREEVNPEFRAEDVREMIIQHILTEDIFVAVLGESDFHRDNNIARELESVIDSFMTRREKRNYLEGIAHYYETIRNAAAGIADHNEKQKFLKLIYETFYKVYNPKGADTLGVVYTPNEIVRFMVESTDTLLYKHFGRGLADKNVEILDPCTGTGTFVTDIIDYIAPQYLEYKYRNEIHANEVAILPYYVSNLNIEYAYKQKMGKYVEFPNICFVDTLDNTVALDYENKQDRMFGFSSENSERIKRQNDRKISVIIGNPPYNAKQELYNDQNANRSYPDIDKRIKETFVKEGTAQNQIVVYDMYTRFYRWAMDRIDENGVISFITNRNFIDGRAYDGYRKILEREFDYCYIIDTKSDVRANPKISGTKNNVFGIQTGVAIMLLVKKGGKGDQKQKCQIYYSGEMEDDWVKEEKLEWLRGKNINNIHFDHITPSKKHNWINLADNDWDELIPLMDKDVKTGRREEAVFKNFSAGLKTQKDEWIYDYNKDNLENKIKYMVDVYEKTRKDENYPEKMSIKWDADLESYRRRNIKKTFDKQQIIKSQYRPYSKRYFYFDKHFNGRTYQWFEIYNAKDKNKYISVPGLSNPKEFHCLGINTIIDLNALPAGSQTLPLYTYDSEGNRRDNITDWGLGQFRDYYKDEKIDRQDIFHYVYGVLHNPEYRQKYELNLKREFPRVPFYEDFWTWAERGKRLMELHIGYEDVEPWALERVDLREPQVSNLKGEGLRDGTSRTPQASPDSSGTPHPKSFPSGEGLEEEHLTPNPSPQERGFKRWKVKLKADKDKGIIYIDENTTLTGVPPEAWEYKLGNRSALEWVDVEEEGLLPDKMTLNDRAKESPSVNFVDSSLKGAHYKVKLKADKDKGIIYIDENTTLTGVPPEAWEYKLGNRSALEWVLDQYKEKKPRDKTIREKFNTYRFADYKEEVIVLLGKVCKVSVETVGIVRGMG